jgi:hypothetical protein
MSMTVWCKLVNKFTVIEGTHGCDNTEDGEGH